MSVACMCRRNDVCEEALYGSVCVYLLRLFLVVVDLEIWRTCDMRVGPLFGA